MTTALTLINTNACTNTRTRPKPPRVACSAAFRTMHGNESSSAAPRIGAARQKYSGASRYPVGQSESGAGIQTVNPTAPRGFGSGVSKGRCGDRLAHYWTSCLSADLAFRRGVSARERGPIPVTLARHGRCR